MTTVSTSPLGATAGPSVDPLIAATATTAGDELEVGSGKSAEQVGVEGEVDVWTGRYSMLNFIGRIAVRVVLTIAAIALAIRAGNEADYHWLRRLNMVFAIIIAAMWLYLGYRMLRAWYSHFYRLTTRRLFVSSGIVQRRREMLELLRIKDVTMRQNSLFERWFGLGTVIVVSTEKGAPTFYLLGVRDPKVVLDRIWHHARSERDIRSVKIDHV
ncbi:PH domain-containing protein [Tundrisphaera sp. TA3]|uniref:PH domain-containing protein n=1 Tax=Tundrisphaera sp. TA3 TaxID=3435775 RepID=UPI003EBBA63C